MKITSIETLRTEEFANVLWVRVHTDSGVTGLGETFYGAGAVEAHIHDKLRVYNTCAGYRYVRSTNIKPVSNWNLGKAEGPYEDLDAFMNRADILAESLLESGITAMKIWPFDPAAQENQGLFTT